MRPRSIAASAATLIAAASMSPLTAHAADSTILYVNSATPSCTDSGSGTSAAPFCTVQAAANAAAPGDTVSVAAGVYAATTVTASGTAAAPITFTGGTSSAASNATTSFTLSGASDVVLENFNLEPGIGTGVAVEGGSDDSIVGVRAAVANAGSGGIGVHVTDAASGAVVRDSYLNSPILVDGGATGTIVSTDEFSGVGVAVVGAPGTAITSNTLDDVCGTAISVTGSSTGSSIENNVVTGFHTVSSAGGCPAQAYGIEVDSDSVTGTRSDYNDVPDLPAGTAPYDWSGALYTSAGALQAATGQGAHDLNDTSATLVQENSGLIDSADSGAIGEQPADIDGNPRVDDPLVTNTGAGTHADYDRGATEFQDPQTGGPVSLTIPTYMPDDTPIPVSAQWSDTWSDPVTYEIINQETGAVLATSTTSDTTLDFPAPGDFMIEAAAILADGHRVYSPVSYVFVDEAAPLSLSFKLATSGLTGVQLNDTAHDGWPIDRWQINWGDGTISNWSYDPRSQIHTYAQGGTYKVTEYATDTQGQHVSFSAQFSTFRRADDSLLLTNSPTGGKVVDTDVSNPVVVANGGIAQSSLAELPGGAAQLLAVTTTGKLEYAARATNGTWQTPAPLHQPSGVTTVKSAGIAALPNGSTQMIEVTSAGTLLLNIHNADGTWQGWSEPAGSTGITEASITAMPNGSSQLVAVTGTGVLKHTVRNANGTWQAGWGTLSQPGITVTDAAIAGMPDGSSQIVEITSGGAIKHDIRYANGSWQATGWGQLLNNGASQISITGLANGGSFVTYASVGRHYWYDVRNANGSWQGITAGPGTSDFPTNIGGITNVSASTLPGTSGVRVAFVNSTD